MSIGVVFDERLVSWPASGSLAERLKQFLDRHPAGREICADAEPVENDVHFRKHLPYYTTTHAGDGFVLVGDAAGFMDPLYSPGMDWVAYTTTAAADLILSHFEGRDIAPLVSAHNAIFTRSYSRWFNALYKDKYQYLGDFQLMRLAFLLDLGLYYLGVASQPYKHGPEALCEPVFSTKPSVPFYHFIAAYNRRFAQIAASRRARHCWGAQNHQRRFMFPGYTFARSSALPIIGALAHWAWLEVTEGWRSWFSRSLERTVPPIPKIPSREAITHPALHDAVPDPAAGALTRRTAES